MPKDQYCGHGSNFHLEWKRINTYFLVVLPQSLFSTPNACHNLYWEQRIGAFSSQGCDQQHWKLKTKLMQVLEFPKISQMATEKIIHKLGYIIKRVVWTVQPWLETGNSLPLESGLSAVLVCMEFDLCLADILLALHAIFQDWIVSQKFAEWYKQTGLHITDCTLQPQL